jgi:hypothetical protein
MREKMKTSLISLVCAMAVSTGAMAAASVRSVGGAGAFSSSASAMAATPGPGRAGSLRTVKSLVQPTTSVSSSKANSVSVSGGTTSSRSASVPRLSIGKYIGTPVSVSSTTNSTQYNDFLDRITNIENQIEQLELEKQALLHDTEYISVDNGTDVKLDIEKLVNDLNLANINNDREIEVNADNADGIKWRYVAAEGEEESEWNLLLSWDALKAKLSIEDINSLIEGAISELDLGSELAKKVDKAQGPENEGKVLVVGSEGQVTLSAISDVCEEQPCALVLNGNQPQWEPVQQ